MFADESNMLVIESMPEHTMLIAPREFIALVVNYMVAMEGGNELLITSAKTLMDNWLYNNPKSLALIKNLGQKEEEDAEGKETPNGERD
jgi:hypothetical protein